MAMMNRIGVIMYNAGLILILLILGLTLKNFNFDSPSSTLEYSQNIRTMLDLTIGILIMYSLLLLLITALSKRKKGRIYGLLAFLYVIFLSDIVVFNYFPEIFTEIGEPVWKYSIIAVTSGVLFLVLFGLVILQLPGKTDDEALIKGITERLKKEEEENMSFCPKCKYKVKQEWRSCPNCSARFAPETLKK